MSDELIAYLADRRVGWLMRDAHGKNLSLLYDTSAPTLAPLYDLVNTVAYPELTTRLAMRIDGAVHIEDVGMESWIRLASEVGVSERFARRTTRAIVERTQAGLAIAYEPTEIVDAIVRRIDALS